MDMHRQNHWIQLVRPFSCDSFRLSYFHRVCERHFPLEALENCESPSDYDGPNPSKNLPVISDITLKKRGANKHAAIRAKPRVPPGALVREEESACTEDCSNFFGVNNFGEEFGSFLTESATNVSQEISAIREVGTYRY